jgi:hypothetical protein
MLLVDSPFSNRLNTNYTPSDPEILEMHALLVDPTDELARMDAQIEAMNAQIKAMVIALNQSSVNCSSGRLTRTGSSFHPSGVLLRTSFEKYSSTASRPSTTPSSILLKRPWSWVTSAGIGEPFYTPRLCSGVRSIFLIKFLRLLARGWRESWRHGSNDLLPVLYPFLFFLSTAAHSKIIPLYLTYSRFLGAYVP